jgi:Carboxypeptidase regulatory-like domain
VVRPRTLIACALIASVLAVGCGGASPSGTAPSAPPLGINCGAAADGYQCRAMYIDAPMGTPRDVTGLATWTTSDANAATINSVGFVTVLRDATVSIRASYRGAEGFLIMDLQAGGQRRYYRALSGFVTDTQDSSKISGVTVQITDGPNVNRSTTTGADGAYQLYDLELGTFTVRFTKSGYASLTRTFTITGDKFNDLSVSLTRAAS